MINASVCMNVCPVNTIQPAIRIRNVTESEVKRMIRSLKPSRGKDIFDMYAVVLKEFSTTLTNPITKITNFSISQGMFPSVWMSAFVVPVFKSEDLLSTSNYRPISILPTVSKVAEKFVAGQIICHLNTSSFALHPIQFGLRASYSTESQLFFH